MNQIYGLETMLDSVRVALCKEGIGTGVKHAAVLIKTMWEKGVLGTSAPWPLLRAAFYTVGLFFSLHGGQTHRDLKISQFSRNPSTGNDKDTYYVYVENGSKNYQGRFTR